MFWKGGLKIVFLTSSERMEGTKGWMVACLHGWELKWPTLWNGIPRVKTVQHGHICSLSVRNCIHSCIGTLVIDLGCCVACCAPAGSDTELL